MTEKYLARPNHTVIAAVRKLDTTLKDVTPAEGSKLVLVKIENESASDPAAAVEQLKAAGITHLDVVIANAGICPVSAYKKFENTTMEEMRHLFDVNFFSFIPLFQAVHPLLKATADSKGEGQAKLLVVSSNAAQIVDMEKAAFVMLGPYGSTKAALNYVVRRVHFENPWLTAWVMNPGFVQSENGNSTAEYFGMKEAPHTIDESASGLISKVDSATRSETSGNFYQFDGTPMTY